MSTSNKSRFRAQRAWWASSSKTERGTFAGATLIILTLAATSAFVWNSPNNPVNTAVNAVDAVVGPTREDELLAERNALLSQVVELQGELDATGADLTASEAEKTKIQAALWKTEGQLEALKASRKDAPVATQTPTETVVTAGAITAPSKSTLVAPKSPYLGLYTEQAPFNWATYDATAKKIGSNPNTVGYFGGWDEKFRANAVTSAWTRKKLPILTWEARPIAAANDVVDEPEYSLPKILDGDFDAYLTKYARDIKKTGLPLGIRLNHEMNGTWYPWSESVNGNSKGDYVKVWKHVHDIFEKEGANKLVIWIWAPNIINNLSSSQKSIDYLSGLYPGDTYVDWVGLSGYLRPNYKPDNDFSFDYTFKPSLDQLRAISNKPIILAEVGASEIGGHKAKWITSLFEGLEKPENSDIVGFSWFSLAVTTYVGGERATNDWRVDSRADTLAAFKAGLNRPTSRFTLTAN